MALQLVDKLLKYIDDNSSTLETKLDDDSKDDIDPSNILPILYLGSGLCVPSGVEYLNALKFKIIIATRTPSRSKRIIDKCKYPKLIETIKLDVENKEEAIKVLDKVVPKCSIMVSMLPWIYHAFVAEFALKYGKNYANTSYIQPAMKALDKKVRDAGLIFLNECGLDPGLDHIDLVNARDEAKERGGVIKSMISICGGLPKPDCNDNPLGYKFSWAPRGVFLAGKNFAEQLLNGKKIHVANKDLFTTKWRESFDDGIGELDWYFNRNSLKYIDIYGGLDEIRTMVRATYRNPGWCETMKIVCDTQLGDDTIRSTKGKTYREYFGDKIGLNKGESLADGLNRILGIPKDSIGIKNLEWIGIMSDEKIPENIPNTCVDVLCSLAQPKMKYKDGERDMVILKNTYDILYKKDGWREKRQSLMINYGDTPKPGWTLPQGVALPLAVAIKLIVTGKTTSKGVIAPIYNDVYKPIMNECNEIYSKCQYSILNEEIYIIAEDKATVLITPSIAKELITVGYDIIIESSDVRCYKDNEYKDVGCKIVKPGDWKDAGFSAYVLSVDIMPKSDKEYQCRYINLGKDSNELIKIVNKNEGEIYNLNELDTFKSVKLTKNAKNDSDMLSKLVFDVMKDIKKRDSKVRKTLRDSFLNKV